MSSLLSRRHAIAALALSLATGAAFAQAWPAKPIRLIVPFPPGGPNDIIARVVGQRMSEILKQTIIIDNRSGQGGVVGTDVVAKAPPAVIDQERKRLADFGAAVVRLKDQLSRLR